MIRDRQSAQKEYYDKRRYAEVKYKIEEIVVKAKEATEDSTKLQLRYKEPMVITKVQLTDTSSTDRTLRNRDARRRRTSHN